MQFLSRQSCHFKIARVNWQVRFLVRFVAATLQGSRDMFETCCNFSATKIASICRDKNHLCKRAFRKLVLSFCTLGSNLLSSRHYIICHAVVRSHSFFLKEICGEIFLPSFFVETRGKLSRKMRRYPSFSLWIPIALANTYFFRVVLTWRRKL